MIHLPSCLRERPYHSDSTASRLLSEVKHCRARLVLRWGTTLESLVLFFCSFFKFWLFACLLVWLRLSVATCLLPCLFVCSVVSFYNCLSGLPCLFLSACVAMLSQSSLKSKFLSKSKSNPKIKTHNTQHNRTQQSTI